MVHKKYRLTGAEELREKLSSISQEIDSIDYSDGVINIFVGNVSEDEVRDITFMLNEHFPKLKVVGMSSATYTILYDMPSTLELGFTLMTVSKVHSFHREFYRESENLVENSLAYAKELNEKIRQIPEVKCIEIYFAWLKASASEFIDILSEGLNEVPIYGAIASVNSIEYMRNYISISNRDSIVLSDKWFGPGVAAVAYTGEDLYIYEDYILGWQPIGKSMAVDSLCVSKHGTTTIWSIDNEKTTDIYKKYLGVNPNGYFVTNVSEFPLVVERNGLLIARTPSSCGDKGEIYLEGDIRPGEKVRFSYAERKEILRLTREGADRMKGFEPEKLSLCLCGNRFLLLQNDAHFERDYYAEASPEGYDLVLGMGELYRYKGQGGVLNSALVALGMREGLSGEKESHIIQTAASHEHYGTVPLAERLSHFLKTMTEELTAAVGEAKAASEAKSSFLSNMSHEIRTPINAIIGMDEMILRECDDKNVLEYAQNIKAAGNTLLSLVNDILDFSKIEAGKMDIIPVDYDFSSVINDLMHMIKPRADAKNLELIFDVDQNIPCILNGDEIRIKQVITNILTNAVKYTEKGSVKLSVGFQKISEESIRFDISVKDTGTGIKQKDLEKMFLAFQRVDEKRNRNIEGTGLGLNISQRLLELMGSRLEVNSVYGEGSEFKFVLEQSVVKWEPIGDFMEAYSRALEKQDNYKEKFTAPLARVLVVDDTPMNITVFTGLLKKTLVQIDTALSGMECLEKTRKKKYDIIFLDHRMPEMDGIETLEALKGEEGNPNVDTVTISLTANAVSGAREQYIAAGFDDYLTKPIMSDKLEAMMLRYLPEDKIETSLEKDEQEEDEVDEATDSGIISGLFNIADLNPLEGIKNCGGTDVYIQTIRAFIDNFVENYDAIMNSFKDKAIENYTIKVHALKSSARIIGAKKLSLLAEKLEKAGNEADINAIISETPILLSLYKKIGDELLKKMPEDTGDENLEEMDPEAFEDAVNSIKELVYNYDYDSITYIIDSMNGYRVPPDKKLFMEKLRRAVAHADWDEIGRIL
ncbi:ATP-binding protein [Butyrivibrio sp. YAB3001]|uniref:ATP-binding protein n=1 Tax=Butyrivibrio sp. YAB3001 TaxID=1520812 RepID=UPI0008F655CB|nr:ATP-binding protein [Butyrivibrio sp. YAB3001]SFC36612.1 Signal transduction histidine kinase [Butyrivibrio sp. YAB3001]